ncbi:hypothetical protein AAHC03_024499 [Spirometra sp. Aus1]
MTKATSPEKSEEPLSRHGAFEYLVDDGSTVDLTQPGLLSRRQLISIFRKRGFTPLIKNLPDKNALLSAYFKHLLPLPARPPDDGGTVTILSDQPTLGVTLTAIQETQKRPSASNGSLRLQPTYKRRAPSPSLDSLVIINNPKWPTSGQSSSAPATNNGVPEGQGCTEADETKRSVPTTTTTTTTNTPSPPTSTLPLKRPKLNRNFANLKR